MSDIDSILTSFNDGPSLPVDLGTPLLMQLDGVDSSLKCHLVGMVPGSFIVVSSPKGPSVESKLFSGNQGVVRYLWGGTVFSFQSAVLGHITKPFALIFLSYPRVVSRHELRREPRLSCHLQARLVLTNSTVPCLVQDICQGGCRIASQGAAANALGGLLTGQATELVVDLGGEAGTVSFKCAVRNSKHENKAYVLGLSFERQEAAAAEALQGLLDSLKGATTAS